MSFFKPVFWIRIRIRRDRIILVTWIRLNVMRIHNTALNMVLTLVEYKGSSPQLEKLINQPVCSEEREEEYERAKRRIFNEMMSPAPHYKYSISLGGTKVGGTGILHIFSRIY